MCFLLSFTIETWHLRAHTLLAEQLNSIRWSRWELNPASEPYCRQRSVYLPLEPNRFISTQRLETKSLKLIICCAWEPCSSPPWSLTDKNAQFFYIKTQSYMLIHRIHHILLGHVSAEASEWMNTKYTHMQTVKVRPDLERSRSCSLLYTGTSHSQWSHLH